MDYTTVKNHLTKIARQAGEYIRGTKATSSTTKKNVKDFVTDADIASQKIIIEGIEKAIPGIVTVSEEHSPEQQEQMYEPDFTGFVIDPIDGTYNFKHDMRASAVSIGYIENGQPSVGVIYDPYKGEMYTAIKGQGAFCNDRPIKVAPTTTMDSANVTTDGGSNDARIVRALKRHMAIYEKTGRMPWTGMHGCAVTAMANVARGRFDAYHHGNLKPWDNAAGFLIVREAGGVAWTLDGKEASFTDPAILVATPEIGKQLCNVFTQLDPGLLG